MTVRNPNAKAALALLEELCRLGVREVCISPGSRSTALVTAALKTAAMRSRVILDERSSAFFALGLARASGRPALAICTSGTAAANFMPAVVEANLSHTPLIVLTADRPPELQDCHAPQTIDQTRLYGVHVRLSIELPAPEDRPDLEENFRAAAFRAFAAAIGIPPGPVHINFPMREPLIDVAEEKAALDRLSESRSTPTPASSEPPPTVAILPSLLGPDQAAVEQLKSTLDRSLRGLIICGPGTLAGPDPEKAKRSILALAERLDWPVLADPLSGMRFGRHDASRIVDAYDVLTRERRLDPALAPQAAIQFGHPLTSKATLEFLARNKPLAFYLVVAPCGTWPDPYRLATAALRADPVALCTALLEQHGLAPAPADWRARWEIASRAARERLNALLADYQAPFEGKVFTELLARMPEHSLLYVGNSMPVRDLDTFGPALGREIRVLANRGANGIDGVLSSAAGASAGASCPTVLVLGDLSFLHDLSGLLTAARWAPNLTAVVLNNDGGAIFSFLPHAALGAPFVTYFVAPHGLKDLAPAAELVATNLSRPQNWPEFGQTLKRALCAPGFKLVEVRTDRDQNLKLHRHFIAEALAASCQALAQRGLLRE